MAEVLYKIEKVRNELRFIRPDGKYYYWDFAIPQRDSCWFNLSGKPMKNSPRGYKDAICFTYDNPHTDTQLRKIIEVFTKTLGCYKVGEPIKKWHSPLYNYRLEYARQLVNIYESLVNLQIYEFIYTLPPQDVFILYDKLGHKKFMREFIAYLENCDFDYRRTLSHFVVKYHEKEKLNSFKSFTKEEQEILKKISGIEHLAPAAQVTLADTRIMRTVLNWWKQYNNNALLKAVLTSDQRRPNDHMDYFRNFIRRTLKWAEECGYKLRTNGDLLKETEAVKEVYKVYKIDKDKQLLKTINLEQWLFEDDNFTVVLPESSFDLIQCGNELNNCVGRFNYWKNMLDGKCFVVFVRRKDDPKKNYVCCEIRQDPWDGWVIAQFLTTNNEHPQGEEIAAFETRYRAFVHSHN